MEADAPPATVIPSPRRKIGWADFRRLIGWCAIGFFVGVSVIAGLVVRRATWEITKPIRFGDIHRGFYWAMQSSGPQGYLNQYEKMDNEDDADAGWGNWLDYAPLRLLLMDQWGSWVRRHYPQSPDINQQMPWDPAYAFNWPVLDFNTGMDALGAACAFFLTRLWVIRTRGGQREKPLAPISSFTGVIPGLIAALTLWFNPAMLLSAYGWPTWDAWVVPMYLLGALLASLDWWFAAGLAIAIGAMFKGQQLTVAPVFVLWALMLGRPGAAMRWCIGLIVGFAGIASPWLFSYLSPHDLDLVRFTHPFGNDPNRPEVLAVRRIIDYPAIAWAIGIVAAIALAPRASRLIGRAIASRRVPAAMQILYALALLPIIVVSLMAWFPAYRPPSIWNRLALLVAMGIPVIALQFEALVIWKRRPFSAEPASLRLAAAPRSAEIAKILAGIAIFAAAAWPWFLARNRHDLWLGILLSAMLAFAAVGLRRTARPFVTAAGGGAAALLCIVVFHGSHSWWDCGFHFGTIHWTTMIMGHTDNLPGLLQVRYDWPESALEHAGTFPPLFHHLPIFSTHHLWPAAPLDLSSKMLFDSIYTVLLLISGVGLGLQARRRDPRFLAALITPWVLFFTIPVQIHERYLLFAAGAAAICIGQSVGAYLLGLFLSFLAFVMALHVMLLNGRDLGDFAYKLSIVFPWLFDPNSAPTILKYIDGTFPDAAWAVILAAGIFLYMSLAPTRRTRTG